MRTGRVPNALPPLLQHNADVLEHLRTADPQAFERLAPLHRELDKMAVHAEPRKLLISDVVERRVPLPTNLWKE